jgi:two-component system cell cycle sensor histidine kinase/response regulator CckA
MPRFASARGPGGAAPGSASLRTGRILCAIGAVAYPLYWLVDRLAGLPVQEPFWLRALLTAPILATLAGSYVSTRVQRALKPLTLGIVYLITANVYALLGLNDLHPAILISTCVVQAGFIATATYTVTTERQLAGYLAFNLACAVGAVLVARSGGLTRLQVLMAVATIASLAYFTVSNHVSTLRRLVQSEQALCLDIARRENVELALRESEARARVLVDAVPDVMLLVDQNGQVIEIYNEEKNRAGSIVAERARDAATLDELFSSTPSRPPRVMLDRALKNVQTQVLAGQTRNPSEPREVEIRIAPTSSDRALALIRDVTEDRAREARVRVADRVVALAALAGGVGHEINNPLAYVLANVDFALEVTASKLPADVELRTALSEAREGCHRIKNIVRNLKEHSEPDQSAIDSTDVNEAIASALRVMDNQLRHRTRVETELGKVPLASASASRLSQVLVNLLGNATDAMPERPMQQNLITVKSTLAASGEIAVEIADNGTGIAPELIDRIFDPFFTTKGAESGTGLGLYLCHKLVTAFGGTIRATSKLALGSTFVVTLPVAAVQSPARARSLAPVPQAPPRVLVIDDEPAIARALGRMLRGYHVQTAQSADAALALCETEHFERVLCDVMMPGKDGAAFYAEVLRRDPSLAKRIVFMTGGAFTEGTRRFLASIDNPVLDKPVDARALLEVLGRAA